MEQHVAFVLSMILFVVDIILLEIYIHKVRNTPEWEDFKASLAALWKKIAK